MTEDHLHPLPVSRSNQRVEFKDFADHLYPAPVRDCRVLLLNPDKWRLEFNSLHITTFFIEKIFRLVKLDNSPSSKIMTGDMYLCDESPHPETMLEWWFVQGHYREENSHKKYFMFSFFRHNTGKEGKLNTEASSFIMSSLHREKSEYLSSTWIEKNLLDLLLSHKNEFDSLNLDPDALKAFLENMNEQRLPSGIKLLPSQAKIISDPLRISWEAFSLSQDHSGFRISFPEPETHRKLNIFLQPLVPPLEISPAQNVGGTGKGMVYSTYPRLKLTGKVNRAKIEGMAWLDHQWGNLGWLVHQNSGNCVLGWDWFGINLENGSDWVVMRHRDAKQNSCLHCYAVRRTASGNVQIFNQVELKPIRFWRSEKTYVSHPIEWRINIGNNFAEFSFFPESEDQEIPVFGMMRSVWEGAGKITGTIDGKKVCGFGRGEFQGYGYIFKFADILKDMKSRINSHLEDFFPKIMDCSSIENHIGPPKWQYTPHAYTKMLSEPIWDLISREGKSWRPVFALLLLHALGTDPAPYEALVDILSELFHTGSLIIDDIEDASHVRRGKESIHLRYGQDVAINAANTIYFLPNLLIFRHPHLTKEQKLEINEINMRQIVRAHYGQSLDLYWSRNMNTSNLNSWMKDSPEPKILQMYKLKTGAPLEGLTETAAVIAGKGEIMRHACVEFAGAFGVAFQIIDDTHCFSTSERWRKTAGEDLAEGKFTYVIVQALKNLKGKERSRLKEIIVNSKRYGDKEMLQEGSRLIRKSNSLQKSRHDALKIVKKKWEALRQALSFSEPLALLHMLYRYLLNLDYNNFKKSH